MSNSQQAILQELVHFVRKNSPYYAEQYASVDATSPLQLTDLPVIHSETFWSFNTVDGNRLLTSAIIDGGIWASGGTTSMPKVSYYTRDELRRLVQAADIGMLRAGLLPGDRIANLFYAGDLYMGFVLFSLCLQELSIPNVLLPISGNITSDSAATHIVDLQATVILTNTTNITRVTSAMIEKGFIAERVRLILFAGEAFYPDLYPLVHRAFPNATIGPLQFSSVDAGMIGLPVKEAPPGSDGIDAVYVANKPSVIVEILNDDDKPITEPGIPGRIVITDLTRRLQPVIRYPMGDVGEWVDYKEEIFRPRGRDSVGVKIGTTMELPMLRAAVAKTIGDRSLGLFQVVVRRVDGKNEMIFRLVKDQDEPKDHDAVAKELQRNLEEIRPQFKKHVADGIVHPLRVEWVTVKELHFNARTGKLKDIIDERY